MTVIGVGDYKGKDNKRANWNLGYSHPSTSNEISTCGFLLGVGEILLRSSFPSRRQSFVRLLSTLASKATIITQHGTCFYSLRSNESKLGYLCGVSDPSSLSNS